MRLHKFLYNICEASISAAIKVKEADDTLEYEKEDVKHNIQTLKNAIKTLKNKSNKTKLETASLSDFITKLRDWTQIYKNVFDLTDSEAEKLISTNSPKKPVAPIDPSGPLDPKVALKLAGKEDNSKS